MPVDRAVGEMAGMPLAVAVEGSASEDAHAFGLRIDQPIRLSENTLVLAEFRAAKGDSDFGILSGGVALRRSLGNGGGFAGVNVFYDALQDSNGFSYSQMGFGAEISYDRFTLRGNGYLPVGDYDDQKTERRAHRRTVRGTAHDGAGHLVESVTTIDWTQTTFTRHAAAWSWEVELEVALRKNPGFFDPRIAVGYYQVGGAHSSEDYSGFLVRGEMRFGEHFVADLEWRQDGRGLGEEWRAGVRWEFLLGRAEKPQQSAGVSDGKTMLAAADGKTTKSPMDGKSGVPPPSMAADPPGFAAPVRRTPWPRVLFSRETENSTPRTTTRLGTFKPPPFPPPDDCDCTSGPPLVFD